MSERVIGVENLSKRYRIGVIEDARPTLGGEVARIVSQPLRNLRKLRSLSNFNSDEVNTGDTIWAIKDISFDVSRGEVVGVIGRNGAGKSTLLKVLAQITDPTAGSIKIKGRVASLLEVGTGFHPELTGRENVYLNGTILGMSRKEVSRKFDEIVDFSGVEKFIDTPVKRYSSGMKVRLAFAVAAHLEPEILIVDEVLAVGDLSFQRKSLGKMRDVTTNEGRTVIFVSHNMAAIRTLCDRAMYLDQGRIAKTGTSDEVVAHYTQTVFDSIPHIRSKPGMWQNPLEDRSYDAKVTEIEMIDPGSGKRKQALNSGDHVTFRLHIDSNVVFEGASVMFGVFSDGGVYLIRYNTETDGIYVPLQRGHTTVDCTFESFPLTAGDYMIATTIGKRGVDPLYRCYDYGRLTVQPRYISESVHSYDSKMCLVSSDHRWNYTVGAS